MSVTNEEIAKIFTEISDILAIKGENRFKVRSYRKAARTLAGTSKQVSNMVEKGEDLTQLPGIGKDLSEKIKRIIENEGELDYLNELRKEVPNELTALMDIEGLGPNKVKQLYDDLGIKSRDELEKAIEEDKVKDLEGFGKKTQEKIKHAIADTREVSQKTRLADAQQVAYPLKDYLEKVDGVKEIIIAGSFRRKKEVVGDLDILAICEEDSKLMDEFTHYKQVEDIIARGDTKSSVRLKSGLQVDIRMVRQESYGSALQYFTGSKEHSVELRKIAVDKKLKVNEYGVFKSDSGEKVAGKTEEEVYKAIGLIYIPPELRENRGEIESAKKDKLPQILTMDDIKGDLHTHTKATDGMFTLEEMAQAAKGMGYEYFANSEHSQNSRIAGGLDEDGVRDMIRQIDQYNEKHDDIFVLKSIELDILKDGNLDLNDDLLKELDFCICSIHDHFKLSEEEQTKRVVKAMKSKRFHIFGHPTGRLIGKRKAYPINLEKIIEAARDYGCFIELNANPIRLDLDDIHCKYAKELAVKVAISTDAHVENGFKNMKYGVNQARRGWLEADDVINTRSVKKLMKLFKR